LSNIEKNAVAGFVDEPEVILVTGSAGLVGHALIKELLRQGKKLRAIYNQSPIEGFNSINITGVQCDILDVVSLEEAMKGVTHLYHCAGLVSYHSKDEKQLFKINVEGTANVVNAALAAGVKRMLHVSSVAALGRLKQSEPIHEKMNWTPETSNSKYGETKYLGEMEVWRGFAEGLQGVIVNPSLILGPGNWNEGSTAIFKSVYDEFPWYTNGSTGFVGVDDVVKVMIALMESEITAERFILSAHNESYRNLFNTIAGAFHKKGPSREVSPFIAKWVTRSQAIRSRFTGKVPLITKETAATALATVQFDNSKLFKFFPSFKYEPLQQTIINTCLALQQKLNLK
jgi:nucleoside-diphosphate-sugar epimerase